MVLSPCVNAFVPRAPSSFQLARGSESFSRIATWQSGPAVSMEKSLATRSNSVNPTNRASALFMVSYEDLMENLPSKPVVDAIEKQPEKSRVVAADVAAAAGVSLAQAKKDLTALASISRGEIAVSSEGELIYSFPENLSSVLAQNSLRYKSLQLFQKAWPLLFWGVRISFGVTLVASIVAIFATIFFISSSSSRDEDDRRGGNGERRGGGMPMGGSFNMFFGPSPFDFFYYRPFGYYGYYGQPADERRSSKPEDMGFLESVFSYVFGDGNPNSDLEEKRLALATNLIRQNQGSVTAEQLAPLCDDAIDPKEMQGKTYVDERFVLPIVTALNGEPRVTDSGDIVYVFPELQLSASAPNRALATAMSSEGMTLRRAGLDENASNRDIKRMLDYNGIAARGVLERTDLVRILDKVLPPMSEEEEMELLESDPSVLQEREWKFSLASDTNKLFAGGLGVANLGGALYLGNLFNQLAAMGGQLPGWYGAVQTFYPALLAYAVLYNTIPAARNFWLKSQNKKIIERNRIRKDWKLALATSIENSSLRKKLAAAKQMGTKMKQIGESEDDIIFNTSQPFEQVKEDKGKSDLDEFDKMLESKDKDSPWQ
eukprot:CAMPEP_0198145434 /NCGR_PEP_ID=MMETSP1443-20131203/23447_1 /TAXON_ID=186043 /ORGANISM="Entomoneis sp., Strain CCMP2396" /LENGTH=601 /DNA_ID=CAMNT_0043809083 /DNA_START=106 /DNA_END=1911 /DNA_ORIENTATION=+